MKAMTATEMRAISGGMWKCTVCGKKFYTYIQAIQHCNNEAHYSGTKVSKFVKFCLW